MTKKSSEAKTKNTTASITLARLSQIEKDVQQLSSLAKHQHQQVNTLKKKTALTLFSEIIGLFGSLCSLMIPVATSYLYFSNFLSVQPTETFKSDYALKFPVVIENSTLINVRDISIDSILTDIKSPNLTITNSRIIGSHRIKNLRANSKHTIIFDIKPAISVNVKELYKADVQINIEYNVLFFKKRFSEKFRYFAVESEGNIYKFLPITND